MFVSDDEWVKIFFSIPKILLYMEHLGLVVHNSRLGPPGDDSMRAGVFTKFVVICL